MLNLFGFIAGQEWIFVIIIVAVFIFGAKKIPELAKTFGKAKGEYEKGKIEGEEELKKFKDSER
ncbi:MAG: twin-arginine translocase TatA/TatE family subunit [Candidatus Nitrosoabyssus spongiisocia]|nr:MAG: twin-arginine translocase TatA/TatE family subunit [Nitrosopumilaceae archaeon AB1(1)]